MIYRSIHPDDAQESYDLLTKSVIVDIMTDADTLKNHTDEIIMIEESDNVLREEEWAFNVYLIYLSVH